MPKKTTVMKNEASPIKEYLKDGKKLFMFQFYAGTDPLTGKRIKTTRRNFKTRKEAQLAYSRLQVEVEKGGFQKKTSDTFAEIYEIWFEQYKNTVKESSYVKTKSQFDLHILPAMGNYRLQNVTMLDCQKHVNFWFSQRKNFRTTCNYASKIFDYAITLGIIQKNPFKTVTMPKPKENPFEEERINFYSKEEMIEFLEHAKAGKNVKAYIFFRLLAFSGLRKGEALALTWKDIDFKGNTLKVTKGLSKGEDQRLLVQTPKTKASIRKITMDERTMEILKEWQVKQKAELKALGHKQDLKGTQLVFSNKDNDLLQPGKTTKWLTHIQDKHDLQKITTHGFRHTHCSILFEAGASIKEVQERLGHTDVQTTLNVYTHVTEKTKEETAKKFANFVNY